MSGTGERGVRSGLAFRVQVAQALRDAGFATARARGREEAAGLGDVLGVPGVAIRTSSNIAARNSELLRSARDAAAASHSPIAAGIIRRATPGDEGAQVLLSLGDFATLVARARR